MHRDDVATGSRQLRDTLERHLVTSDLPAAKRGPRGAIGRLREKAERFAPGAGRKHRKQADADYIAAVTAADQEHERGTPGPSPSVGPDASGEAGPEAGGS